MNERDIFLAAIEISNSAERAVYLDQVCAGNPELRAQVEELLRTQDDTSQFLETPAVATDSAVDRTVLTGASDTDEDSDDERASGKVEFRKYLEPATRPGWLGRLAHYEIEEILGRGAFGIVAKAFDEKLHRVVAIKLMSPELASTSPPRKRFLREARTAAAVTHENIVAIHAVEEEPIPYLVMEYISGQTLQQRIDGQGPLEAPDVLRIGQQLAAGLAAAHSVNLIHRDIKPSNILLSDGSHGRAKISDFGLARAVDDATMSRSGMIAGTPMYMAPEQARSETLDHRADLFSLGSVLYQMAGGRPPFRAANTVAVLKRVCEDTPRALADVLPGTPDWLETIIFKLLEKDRDDRYQTAQEVADLLSRCQRELEDSGKVTCVEVSAGNPATQVFRPQTSTGSGAKKKPLGWLVGAVIAVAAVIGIVLMDGGTEMPDHYFMSSAGNTTSDSTNEPPVDPTVTDRHGWPEDQPDPAIVPFDAEQAKAHQEAWAKYLGVPVEREILLGQHEDGEDVVLTMVLIPPGEFMMGSSRPVMLRFLKEIEEEANPDTWAIERMPSESPQHPVRITEPFYLAKYETTQAQWMALNSTNPSTHPGERLPVEMVNWNEAHSFAEALNGSKAAPDLSFSLPTEAQWEHACRAGTTTIWHFGDNPGRLEKYAWTNAKSMHQSHPVGQLLPNAWGLCDMYGNVREWCQDWHAPDYYSESPVNDPTGSVQPSNWGIVTRGGSSHSALQICRSAYRHSNSPEHRAESIGFRLAAHLSLDLAPGKRHAYQRPADASPPAIAPFDADQAKAHQ